jgi:hypothetical protein
LNKLQCWVRGRIARRKRFHAADEPGPAPSEQRVEQETVATAEKRSGKQVKKVKCKRGQAAESSQVASARAERQRRINNATGKQLSSPAVPIPEVKIPALGPTTQERKAQDSPQMPGAFPVASD